MPKPQPEKIDLYHLPQLAKEVIKKAKFPMLATMDHDQPRVRPVSPVKVDGFSIYVANLSYYDKTKQIKVNPKVELCYLSDDHDQVRITGVAEVVKDRNLLQEIWDSNNLLMHYLGSVDNPQLIVYKIVPTQVRYMQEWALKYYEVAI